MKQKRKSVLRKAHAYQLYIKSLHNKQMEIKEKHNIFKKVWSTVTHAKTNYKRDKHSAGQVVTEVLTVKQVCFFKNLNKHKIKRDKTDTEKIICL